MLILCATGWFSTVAMCASSMGGGFCEPSLVNSFEIADGWVARPLAISGDLLLATDGSSNLLVYTLTAPGSPDAPVLLDAFDLPGATVPTWIEVDGEVALVGGFDSAHVVDLSDPSVPVASSLGPYNAQVSAVEGDIALARFSASTLSIWDVSDPSSPSWLTDIFGSIRGVALHDGIVYRLGGDTLTTFDLSDPSQPAQLDELDGLPAGGGSLSDLVVEGDRLYMISTDAGIRAVDISDPSNLVYLGAAPASIAETMDVSGSVAYLVPQSSSELQALDLATPGPAVPTVAVAPLPGPGYWARQHNGYLYVTHLNGSGTSISIFDMSPCPAAPIITAQPQSIVADDGAPAVPFEVSGALIAAYQWRFNGEPIANGGPYSGATTSTLMVQPMDATEGTYDVQVTNLQGTVTSQAAVLAVIGGATETCAADLTDDSVIDVSDLLQLLGAWGPCP